MQAGYALDVDSVRKRWNLTGQRYVLVREHPASSSSSFSGLSVSLISSAPLFLYFSLVCNCMSLFLSSCSFFVLCACHCLLCLTTASFKLSQD